MYNKTATCVFSITTVCKHYFIACACCIVVCVCMCVIVVAAYSAQCYSISFIATMVRSGSVSISNTEGVREKPEKNQNACTMYLFGCCLVLFVVSACLLTVLILIGKRIVIENENRANKSSEEISKHDLPLDLVRKIDTKTYENKTKKVFKRLSSFVSPVHYELFLNPDLVTGDFGGNVGITLNVSKETDVINFNSKNLKVFDVKLVSNENNNTVEIFNVSEKAQEELYEMKLKSKIDIGVYLLSMNFSGVMKNKRVGLYKSEHLGATGKRSIATSKFEPTYARQAFPCFDEPNMKAEYTVTLVKPAESEYIALSNMDVKEVSPPENGKQVVKFNKSVRMSTYLTCFIVCDFHYTEDTVVPPPHLGKNITFRVYATPQQKNKTQFALQTGVAVTKHYIDYFQIEYPLPKLDMAAIPDFSSGAMETWGLITYRETTLLYDPKINSVANKQNVARVVAHELSHMWFGNLVTMNWWNDIWLNEGFATYIQYIGVDVVYPKWKMLDQFLISELHVAFNVDAKYSSHPIIQKVENPDEIAAIFDTISYSKGGSVLRMLDNFVGNDNFRKGITKYLTDNKYKNAKTQDLFDAIQTVVGDTVNVTAVMDTWTHQMGYPEVMVKKLEDGKYVLTQSRFIFDTDNSNKSVESEFGYKWTIPITYISNKNSNITSLWFPRTEDQVIIDVDKDTEWIKLNVHQVGYYRVNYEEDLWKKLISIYMDMLSSDKTSIVEDSFSLANAGRLNYSVPLELSMKLMDENEYVPWAVLANKFNKLRKLLLSSQYLPNLRKYMQSLVDKKYKDLTWQVDEDTDDNHLRRKLRLVVLDTACTFGHAECLKEVGEKFESWLQNPTEKPPPDIRALIYHHGMSSRGTETSWNKMWSEYKKETDAAEKQKIIHGLANIREPWILTRLINLAWDENNVRRQDYFNLLQYISTNPVGTSIVWDYVRENWEKLVNEFTLNDRYLGRLILPITSSFTTKFKLKEMKDFFALHPEAGAGETPRKQAIENVENNIKWLEKYERDVGAWLENH